MFKKSKFDLRVRQYVLPARILWQSRAAGAVVENAQSLLNDTATSGQATLDSHCPCILRHQGGPAGVLLDFGRELHGGIEITTDITENKEPVRVRVRFGESASEAMSDVTTVESGINDHSIGDQKILLPWLGSCEVGNTGFRFVRIELVDKGSSALIKSIRAVFVYRDLEYKGSFHCSDERLNRIWQTGAYTVHLNMQQYLWDGIKRDRLVWVGDMHPETMTINSVFGKVDVVSDSLDLARDETPLPNWINGISSYSMWWVLIHHVWYMYHGDIDYLRQQKSYMAGLLELLIGCVGPDNREQLEGMRFLDWPSSENKPAIHAGLHSLLVMTLQAGAELMGFLQEKELSQKYMAAAGRLKKHIPDHNNSKQAAALMSLAGLVDAGQMNQKVMAIGGAGGMSTFYGYYVLQARAMAGDYQGCLDCIRRYWGAMLDLGATAFWEDFNLDWIENAAPIDELVPAGKKDIHGDFGNYCYKGFRHSLCHGWASGPTAWLSEHVLGIRIIDAGAAAIKIEPHLADLKWAEGTFPTVRGIIRVKHTRQPDGTVKSDVDVPKQIKVVG